MYPPSSSASIVAADPKTTLRRRIPISDSKSTRNGLENFDVNSVGRWEGAFLFVL